MAAESSAQNIGESPASQAQRESVVARLALRALHGLDVDSLIAEVVTLVTETIDADGVYVLELQSDGTPRLRGGVGPTRGIADRAALALARDQEPGQAGTDAPKQSSFVLREGSRPVGVLDVSPRSAALTGPEQRLLQSIASVLSGAMQREREAAALRASEERFRMLVDGVRDHALILLDAEGRVSTWNPGAERIRGYSSDEIIGRHFSCFYVPSDRNHRPVADLAVATTRGRHDQRGWQAQKGGGRFFGETTITALRDERRRLVGFAHVTRDISIAARSDREKKLLAEAGGILAQSLDYESTLNRIAELAVPAFADWCMVDVVGDDGAERVAAVHASSSKVDWARRAAGRPLLDSASGGGASEVIRSGRPVLVSEVTPEMLRAAARDAFELEQLRASGICSYLCVPLNARGHCIGAITFVADESQRRYDSADLALAEELARRCAIAVDNARLYHQAQQALRDRNQFFSIASHELRTPLAALQLYLGSVLRMLTHGSLARAGRDRLVSKAGTAIRQVERMSKLVDNLLDATQLERGFLRLEPEEFDAADLVREVVERFQEAAAEVSSTLVGSAPPSLPVYWDRIRIDQVITNLISNAIKYSPGRPIEVAMEMVPHRVRIVVRDHGGGIPARDLTRIFRPFGRGGSEGKPAGLGLGLFISRRIIEGHGGSIRAESVVGDATCFIAELPLRMPGPSPSHVDLTQPVHPGDPGDGGIHANH